MTTSKPHPAPAAQRLQEALDRFAPIVQKVRERMATPEGAGWVRVCDVLKRAKLDPAIAASPPAAEFIQIMLDLASDAISARDAETALRPLDGLMPLGELGAAFKQGRKRGSVSELRLAVRRVLKRRPKATAAEVWKALKAKPPRGITLHDRWGERRYIKTDGKPDTGYARFRNIVSEERPK